MAKEYQSRRTELGSCPMHEEFIQPYKSENGERRLKELSHSDKRWVAVNL